MTFPFSLEQPIEHGGALPDAVDLVIIGGGVIGVTAALYAAKAGLRVCLLEKGRIAAEQSGRNWGWIRAQGRDMAEIPIAHEAQRMWQSLDDEAQGALGVKIVGCSYLARTQAALDGFKAWLEDARALGVSSQMLSKEKTQALTGVADSPWYGALHTPTDMKAEPWQAVPQLARMAADAGALIREGCAVRGLDIQAGRVAGVVTEAGRIRADQVVLAGGAWSSLFLRRHGVSIPQLSVRSTVLATGPKARAFPGAAVDDRLATRPRDDGGYTLAPAAFSEIFIGPDAFRALPKYMPLIRQGGFQMRYLPAAPKGYPDAWGTPRRWADEDETPFERMRILDPTPNASKQQGCLDEMARLWGTRPVVAASWAGMIDVMPDVVPVVDRCDTVPGLTVVTGMCGHGFGIGPAFGRIAFALAMDEAPGHDLHRFRMSRFRDGSKMVPGPNI